MLFIWWSELWEQKIFFFFCESLKFLKLYMGRSSYCNHRQHKLTLAQATSVFSPFFIFFFVLLGSVFWYFVLLNYVKEEDLSGCSTACASLLTAISRQLQDRLTPLEALLQTRLISVLHFPLKSTFDSCYKDICGAVAWITFFPVATARGSLTFK